MFARNATSGGVLAGGTLGVAVNADTWEFKIATFTINAGLGFGGGQTSFNVVQPNAKATAGAFTYASVKVDGATFNVSSANTQGAYAGSSGVTFPEPSSAGLLGAAAVALLGRRRK